MFILLFLYNKINTHSSSFSSFAILKLNELKSIYFISDTSLSHKVILKSSLSIISFGIKLFLSNFITTI